MTIWNIITEYIHDDEVLYLNEVSRVDALCVEYLTKCHIRKQDPEILALLMKKLPNELKYHLSLLVGSGDGMRSWK